MAKIRLTKEFKFETAHALHNYDGLCRNLHGHSYILFVTVIGEPIIDENNPKLGMVMDFGVLKRIVNTQVIDTMDHSIVLSNKSDNLEKYKDDIIFERFHIVNYQPTCENMIVDFAERISTKLPEGINLFSLKLHETASSYAEWFASDNQL